jgi:hypothetical protein
MKRIIAVSVGKMNQKKVRCFKEPVPDGNPEGSGGHVNAPLNT